MAHRKPHERVCTHHRSPCEHIHWMLNTTCTTQTRCHSTSDREIRTRRHGSGKYRPISNLSFISKFIERVIHRQLSTYAESNNLLPSTRSGFRRSHSTETAVIKVYNDVVLALDSGLQTALLPLDFSAAFDCVDHARSAHSRSTSLFMHHIISTRLDQIISLKQNPLHQTRQQHIETMPRQVLYHRVQSLVHWVRIESFSPSAGSEHPCSRICMSHKSLGTATSCQFWPACTGSGLVCFNVA